MAYIRLDWVGKTIVEGAALPPSTGGGQGMGTVLLLAIAGAIGLMLFGGKKR